MADDVDATLREICSRGAWEEAATLALSSFGAEVAAYVRAIARPGQSEQAYSDFAVDLWRGIPQFEWRCSARAFAFTLARHAVFRASRSEQRQRSLEQTWATERWLFDAIERTRTSTPAYLKSEVKAQLSALRERLSEEERSLLILRVDRGLSFSDLVAVLDEGVDSRDAKAQARSEARLRKRYQALKDKLKQMVVAEGLAPESRTK